MSGKEVATETLIRATVVAAVALITLLILYASEIFLVVFAGMLLAILFRAMSNWIARWTGLADKWATAIALLTPFLLLGLFFWYIAPDVSDQASELADRVPKAFRQLQEQLLQYDWANRIMEQQGKLQDAMPSGSKAVSLFTKFFSSTFGAIGNLVIALAIGIFLSINPQTYVGGLMHLVPLDKRRRAGEVLEATRSTLASWLTAKLIEMAVIGVLTTIGLWIIGIDLALVLGIIAALLSFIPNIGPIISVIPALLIALVDGFDQVLYVIALYAGIQTVESYILTPLLQQHMVDLPPALTVGMQVLGGFLAGALGVILATPLTAAAMVMIRMWYVEDMLGDRSVDSG
ncbi:AI-2E family transporter [Noviherbaspirillum agri]